jgi:outer membrane receptor for ferrienterochelin and colicins
MNLKMRKFSLFLSFLCAFNAQMHGQLVAPINTDSLMPDAQKEIMTVVITGQFQPTDARQTVNLVRTIDQETIKSRGVNNLEELLSTDANIRVSQDGIFGSAARLNGLSGENLKILVDGVPVMGRLNGNLDLGQISMQAVKQVEIIDGAQSLMYGSQASAGVINLITKRSQAKPFEASAKTQLESNGFATHQARLGLQKGKFFWQLNGTDLTFQPNADSLRNQAWNPKRQQNMQSTLRYRAGDAFDIRVTASSLNETVDNLGEIRRPQYKPYAFDDIYRTKRKDATVHAEGWMGKKAWFWQGTSGINDFYRMRNSYRYDADNDTLALLDGQQDTSGSRGVLHRATLASDLKHRSGLNVLLGAEHFTEWATGIRFVDTSALTPGRVRNTDLGIFSSIKWQPYPTLTIQGGARYTKNQVYGSVVTPSVWLAWQPNTMTQLRLSYANGFRSPGMKELYFQFIDVNHFITGNTALSPERSHNLRADIKRQLCNKPKYDISLSASGFYNDINDRITLVEVAAVQYTYLNIADWRTLGGGLTLSAQLWDRLTIQSAAVQTAFYNELHDTPGIGANALNWSLDWTNDLRIKFLHNRITANVWHKRTGKTPYFFSEDLQVKSGTAPAWSLLNASLSSHFWDQRINVITGVKNILNRTTLENQISDGIHAPVASVTPIHWGRTYFVGVEVAVGGGK